MYWKVCATSIEGTSHIAKGMPCQDCSMALRLSSSSGSYLILIAADGCGSSTHSDIGSQLVAYEIVDCLAYWIKRSDVIPMLSDLLVFALGHANQMLHKKAIELSVPVRELASTCLCVVVGPSGFAAAQIGDGVIVRRSNGITGCLFWPSQEYANVTHTLADKDWFHKIQIHSSSSIEDSSASWFVATDGVQDISCDAEKRIPHPGFVDALLDKLDNVPLESEPLVKEGLARFLRSDRVNSVVSDDKTIVLACP